MQLLRLAPLLASLGLVACGPVNRLDETSGDLAIEVFVFPAQDDPTALEIHATLAVAGGPCIALDDTFAGSLDGLAPFNIERGGHNDTSGGCWPPSATFLVHADQRVAPATIILGDSTRTIAVDLADRLVPRTGVLVSPDDGVIRPGVTLVLDWSSATDLAVADPVLFLDRGPNVATLRPTVRGDQLIVEAPATLPTSGEGEARMVLADDWTEGGIELPCTDATCSLRAWFEVVIPISFGP